MASSVRIAVVGDVHNYWNLKDDSKALQLLQPDLVLFTGDFGEENVEIVRSVSELNIPKAIILGNHDAWWTANFSEKDKDRVQLQLECLGNEHVGYGRLDFPNLKLSVVGGRPFSGGGDNLFREKLLLARYGVHDMEESRKKIYEAALGTPDGYSVIILAHNGPTGLGSKINDICGRDWVDGGGDHGDPDLAQAISDLKGTTQLHIPLVIFGHMHKELAYNKGLRKMIVTGADNTVYLNGAIVPRVKKLNGEQEASNRSFMNNASFSDKKLNCEQEASSRSFMNNAPFPVKKWNWEQEASRRSFMNHASASALMSGDTVRAFTIVETLDGELEKVVETWVSVIGDEVKLEEEHVLYKKQ